MRTVKSRKDLRHCTSQYIYVERERSIYVWYKGEYLIKRYFTVSEAMTATGRTRDEVYGFCRKFIQPVANRGKKIRITLPQLRQMQAAN
jgi:hypothetical protein